MKRTLLLSLSPSCEGSCSSCPFVGGERLLSYDVLKHLLETLERVDETVVVCSWASHPDLLRIGKLVLEASRKVIWLVSPAELAKLAKVRAALSSADELMVVTHEAQRPPPLEQLKTILSAFDLRIGLWWVFGDSPSALGSFRDTVKLAQSMGLKLVVGETPYSCDSGGDASRFALALKAEVGLPMGQVYGYTAARAYFYGYPALLLLRPLHLRGFLYLSHEGLLRKHPRDPEAVNASEADTGTLRKLLFSSGSPCINTPAFRLEVQLSMREDATGTVITPQMIALLEAIHSVKSLKAACAALGIPYPTCLEKLKTLERNLGRKLVETRRGGKSRGVCHLTEFGLQVLAAYREALRAVYERIPG